MGKFRYTKEELEILVYKQLANLEAFGRRIQLLEKQNELLVKYNHKLAEALCDRQPPVPYSIKNNRKPKGNPPALAAKG